MERRKIHFRINTCLFLLILFILTNCEGFERGKTYNGLTGAWSCQESSAYSGFKKYFVEIDKVTSSSDLYIISNFHNQGENEFIYSSMRNDSLFIDNQSIGGFFIRGEGIVNSDFNRVEILYYTDDGSIELEYFVVYSR